MFDQIPPALMETILFIAGFLIIGTAVIAGFIIFIRLASKYRLSRREIEKEDKKKAENKQCDLFIFLVFISLFKDVKPIYE